MTRGGALLAVVALACEPTLRGRCGKEADCRSGSVCSLQGVCIAASGSCSPGCARGELCNQGSCAVLKPVVSVSLDPGAFLSPRDAQVRVHVDASPSLTLGALAVEVDTDHAVATGSIGQAAAGDQDVPLTQFEPGLSAQVSVRAALSYALAGAAVESVRSVAVPALIDNLAPTLSVSGDGLDGWVARSGQPLRIVARVADGQGSGPQLVTLSFDACPEHGPCSVAGDKAGPTAGGAALFAFQVPRDVQSAGSEAPLPATVTAVDRAGNAATTRVSLEVDDAPPRIGAVVLPSAGVTGEDGNPWFAGGASAPPVEIAVPVSDSGSGLSAVTLELEPDDVAAGTPLAVPPILPDPPDGTVRFRLPASAVQGREGLLRFTVAASDQLQHPAEGNGAIFVDDLPPIVSAATVQLATVQPPTVCDPSVICGRAANRLLRDDTVTVTFDAHDCGAGLVGSQALEVGSGTLLAGGGTTGSACGSSPNQGHRYSFEVRFGTLALGDAASDGTALVPLIANARDAVAHSARDPSAAQLLSLWRWKRVLAGLVTGSPALLAGTAGSRRIAVGTSFIGGDNLFVLDANGGLSWSAALASGIGGDVATGAQGAVYAVSPRASCVSCSATLNIATATGSTACPAPNAIFGAPFALASISGQETAVVAASGTSPSGSANLWLFDAGCSGASTVLPGRLSGASVSGGSAFLSGDTGFVSVDLRSPAPPGTSTGLTSPARQPPALALPDAVYGASTGIVRARLLACPPGAPCWQTVDGFSPADLGGAELAFSPVFAGATLWGTDSGGTLRTWSFASGGAAQWTFGPPVSGPALLQGGSAAVLGADGNLQVVTPPSTAPRTLGSYGAVPAALGLPFPPLVDTRDTLGVAYVVTGGNQLTAVMTPAAPLEAGPGVWPRPGRDSCNSRSEGFPCP